MSSCKLAPFLILWYLVVPAHAGGGSTWAYQGKHGPDHWRVDYKDCGGSRQSPINIVTSEVEFDADLKTFDLSELSNTEGVEMTLENVQGHTVEVHLGGPEMVVTGGGLEGKYGVNQFHFHWGAKDERGSEHTINGFHFPMEMHIVMYSLNYTDISAAISQPDGLAVLGFFFKVGEKNDYFEQLLQYFDKVEYSEDTFEIPTVFPLKSLLPDSAKSFYRYDGSLTTPPCSETVVWSLFTDLIEVAEEQLQIFRDLKRNRFGETDEELADDFRPIQPLNDRIVTTNNNAAIYDLPDPMTSS